MKKVSSSQIYTNQPKGALSAAANTRFQFRASRKYHTSGVARIVPPEKTIEKMRPLMDSIGVTRVGDITGLDKIGIPTFVSVRPKDLGPGISYYNGKGLTSEDSEAGAMMEAIERYSGEQINQKPRIASINELKNEGNPFVEPGELISPRICEYDKNTPLEWVSAVELNSKESYTVPLNYVICPYGERPGVAITYSSTNGLASGNCIEEAVCHGICEVIERDASALSAAQLTLLPGIRTIMGDAASPETEQQHKIIDIASLPSPAKKLVERTQLAGLEIYLRDITSDVGVCTIDCTIIDRVGFSGSPVAHGGTGTHPDSRVAVIRAISEAAQSRLAHIQGGREDLTEIVDATVPALDPLHSIEHVPQVHFSSLPTVENQCIREDISFLLGKLKSAGLPRVLAVDMTQDNIAIPVVRILIQGAETWSVFNLHAKRGEFGSRVKRLLQTAKTSE